MSDETDEIVRVAGRRFGSGRGWTARDSAGQVARRATSVAYEVVAVLLVAALVHKSQVDVAAERPLQLLVVFAAHDVARHGYVAVFTVENAIRPYLDAHLVAMRVRIERAACVRIVVLLQRVVLVNSDGKWRHVGNKCP